MRISDWSSDVCSSDLKNVLFWVSPVAGAILRMLVYAEAAAPGIPRHIGSADGGSCHCAIRGTLRLRLARMAIARKSVASGKSVPVRVDNGGRRSITKTNSRTIRSHKTERNKRH